MKATTSTIDFTNLWERLMREANLIGDSRMKAVLMNHERRKEHICRKLGAVSDADVNRIATGMRER